MADTPDSDVRKNEFGTFGGVFTPSMLTIFGLIMFMRSNYVIGNAGILQAVFILSICNIITFSTSLSISAISTNTPIKGGGAYFLISRVLGPGFGTAIGIALFLAQALSVPFYIIGFTEALTDSFGLDHESWALWINLTTLFAVYIMIRVGTSWVIKVQYIILTVLVLSILSFLIGAGRNFSMDTFNGNLQPHYTDGHNRWTLLAIYFPAVTGIMAGVNMSGDLKNPGRSIPVGTLAAVVVGYLVYGAQIILSGGSATNVTLIAAPYLTLKSQALFQFGGIIVAGVFCATLSSAIGSKLGAPRILQAVGRDGVLHGLNFFAKGTKKGDEPMRAMVLTAIISAITLVLASFAGKQGLDIVANVVTMVFLYTYGMTNLAAFVESRGSNPSFRPRFRFFHWTSALAGGVGCVWVAFMISAVAATVALVMIAILFYVVRNREMSEVFGDARWGYVYSRLNTNLTQLAALPRHPKNWRPTILVFSGNPNRRLALIEYARWIGQKTGIVSLVQILIGKLSELKEQKKQESERLQTFISENELNLFSEVVVLEDFDRDLNVFLQSYSIGPIKPNVVLLGWPHDSSRLAPYYAHIRTMSDMQKNIIIMIDHGLLSSRTARRRIDLWWRGMQNGSLMIIIAHLLMNNPEWDRASLRLLRMVGTPDEVPEAEKELLSILEAARIPAESKVPVSDQPFPEVLKQHSQNANLVMLGFTPPPEEFQEGMHEAMDKMLAEMPTTMLVYSSGEADLMA